MMKPRTLTLGLLGLLLGCLSVPSLAAEPAQPGEAAQPARARELAESHARQVEVPFPLDFGSPAPKAERPAPAKASEPHPFREIRLQRG